MKLEIISPEKVVFSGDVELVGLPGIMGRFTILPHHAPVISSLEKGTLVYRVKGEDTEANVNGGFIEMNGDSVTVCID